MEYISHRGFTDGPDDTNQNRPDQIDKAISLGFGVEIDVWYINKEWYLGHDGPLYKVSFRWLHQRAKKLWIHCKSLQAANQMAMRRNSFNSFLHRVDKAVFTTHGYLWTFPGELLWPNSVCVMPENYLTSLDECVKLPEIVGICTDFPIKVKEIRNNAGLA